MVCVRECEKTYIPFLIPLGGRGEGGREGERGRERNM